MLVGADLTDANFNAANLSKALLKKSTLKKSSIYKAKLEQSELCGAILPDGTNAKSCQEDLSAFAVEESDMQIFMDDE
jgi:uncharacterized protein YjbI with pentapeptide repeats